MHNPGQLDTHPLVREYFGEQLRSQQTDAWRECNSRLYHYYRTLVPQLPNTFREMDPLFSAVICGCNAGLFREALHEVYIPRIQRGDASFANVLGARGTLLSVLVHFFEHGRWGSLVETAAEGQSLTAEDQLFILMQAAKYLTATRGLGAPEARICYERAEPLCHSLNRPRFQCCTERSVALFPHDGQADGYASDCGTNLLTGAGTERAGANDRSLRRFGNTHYFWVTSRPAAICNVWRKIWRSGGERSPSPEDPSEVACLCCEPYSSGISERSPPPKKPSRKRSH